jgi:hypothetical protein
MPPDPAPVSLADVASRAAEIADPTDTNPGLGEPLMEFEDDDEPVRAVLDGRERRVADTVARIDPEIEDPAVSIAPVRADVRSGAVGS